MRFIRRHIGVAILALVAAVAAWLVFLWDALLYAVGENGPDYYSFSDYVKYRDAQQSVGGWAIGVGYALLAGALVAAAAVLRRRAGPVWAAVVALAAVGAIALPAVVPAHLSRAERGKDAAFFHTPGPGDACFLYAVERFGTAETVDPHSPKLCVRLSRHVSSSELENELSQSGVRPYDAVSEGDIDAVSRSWWENTPP
jgi:hypothetical protein